MAKVAVMQKGTRRLTAAKLKASLPQRPLCFTNHWKKEPIKCPRAGRSRGLCVNHYNMLCRLVRIGETTWEEQIKLGHCLDVQGNRAQSEGAQIFLPKGKRAPKKKAK